MRNRIIEALNSPTDIDVIRGLVAVTVEIELKVQQYYQEAAKRGVILDAANLALTIDEIINKNTIDLESQDRRAQTQGRGYSQTFDRVEVSAAIDWRSKSSKGAGLMPQTLFNGILPPRVKASALSTGRALKKLINESAISDNFSQDIASFIKIMLHVIQTQFKKVAEEIELEEVQKKLVNINQELRRCLLNKEVDPYTTLSNTIVSMEYVYSNFDRVEDQGKKNGQQEAKYLPIHRLATQIVATAKAQLEFYSKDFKASSTPDPSSDETIFSILQQFNAAVKAKVDEATVYNRLMTRLAFQLTCPIDLEKLDIHTQGIDRRIRQPATKLIDKAEQLAYSRERNMSMRDEFGNLKEVLKDYCFKVLDLKAEKLMKDQIKIPQKRNGSDVLLRGQSQSKSHRGTGPLKDSSKEEQEKKAATIEKFKEKILGEVTINFPSVLLSEVDSVLKAWDLENSTDATAETLIEQSNKLSSMADRVFRAMMNYNTKINLLGSFSTENSLKMYAIFRDTVNSLDSRVDKLLLCLYDKAPSNESALQQTNEIRKTLKKIMKTVNEFLGLEEPSSERSSLVSISTSPARAGLRARAATEETSAASSSSSQQNKSPKKSTVPPPPGREKGKTENSFFLTRYISMIRGGSSSTVEEDESNPFNQPGRPS